MTNRLSARTAVLSLLLTLPAAAATIVDQLNAPAGMNSGFAISSFSAGANGATGQTGAQVFTVGLTGQLTEVDVPLWNYSARSGQFILQLWNVTSGTPVEPPTVPLASASVDAASLPASFPGIDPLNWTAFNVSSANLFVTAGESYAIVVSADGLPSGSYVEGGWGAVSDSSPYAGGAGFIRGANASNTTNYTTWQSAPDGTTELDFGFRTLVDTGVTATPEPSSFALASLALAGVWMLRRRGPAV